MLVRTLAPRRGRRRPQLGYGTRVVGSHCPSGLLEWGRWARGRGERGSRCGRNRGTGKGMGGHRGQVSCHSPCWPGHGLRQGVAQKPVRTWVDHVRVPLLLAKIRGWERFRRMVNPRRRGIKRRADPTRETRRQILTEDFDKLKLDVSVGSQDEIQVAQQHPQSMLVGEPHNSQTNHGQRAQSMREVLSWRIGEGSLRS